jgi:hypothetical protein
MWPYCNEAQIYCLLPAAETSLPEHCQCGGTTKLWETLPLKYNVFDEVRRYDAVPYLVIESVHDRVSGIGPCQAQLKPRSKWQKQNLT